MNDIKSYLEGLGDLDIKRIEPASEDASFRKYYRVYTETINYILMDSPPDKEPCGDFIKITELLHASGLGVPKIHHKNLEKGFLLLDDFGSKHYLDCLDEKNADMLYQDAIDSIVQMQNHVACDGLPVYDREKLENEVTLFSDWLVQRLLGIKLSDTENNKLRKDLNLILDCCENQPKAFVHRDYHSRNLLYLENNNPGIIDYQDAVFGPISYDLVSLLKDCYISWPQSRVLDWVRYYLHNADIQQKYDLDPQAFYYGFDLMGVQRHLKASGIFARLLLRDNKPAYIKDIPRTLSYITSVAKNRNEISFLGQLIENRILPKITAYIENQCTQ